MPFGMWTRVGPRNHVLDGSPGLRTRRGNFEGEKWPAEDTPGHVPRSIYSKRLKRGQHQYSMDAYWMYYTVSQKRCQPNHGYNFVNSRSNLQNSFTATNSTKFSTKPVLGYPPHLKYVAALPWKT